MTGRTPLLLAIVLCGALCVWAQGLCSSYASCETCALGVDCGWCHVSRTCEAGNVNGSTATNTSCASDVGWDFGACPCSGLACDDCLDSSLCAWDLNTYTCARTKTVGGIKQPVDPSVDLAYSCPLCALFSRCDTCTAVQGCAYCITRSQCVSTSVPCADAVAPDGSCSSTTTGVAREESSTGSSLLSNLLLWVVMSFLCCLALIGLCRSAVSAARRREERRIQNAVPPAEQDEPKDDFQSPFFVAVIDEDSVALPMSVLVPYARGNLVARMNIFEVPDADEYEFIFGVRLPSKDPHARQERSLDRYALLPGPYRADIEVVAAPVASAVAAEGSNTSEADEEALAASLTHVHEHLRLEGSLSEDGDGERSGADESAEDTL